MTTFKALCISHKIKTKTTITRQVELFTSSKDGIVTEALEEYDKQHTDGVLAAKHYGNMLGAVSNILAEKYAPKSSTEIRPIDPKTTSTPLPGVDTSMIPVGIWFSGVLDEEGWWVT